VVSLNGHYEKKNERERDGLIQDAPAGFDVARTGVASVYVIQNLARGFKILEADRRLTGDLSGFLRLERVH
jgi:hypothetical protein